MDAAFVGAVFAGLTGLTTAIGGLLLNRQRSGRSPWSTSNRRSATSAASSRPHSATSTRYAKTWPGTGSPHPRSRTSSPPAATGETRSNRSSTTDWASPAGVSQQKWTSTNALSTWEEMPS